MIFERRRHFYLRNVRTSVNKAITIDSSDAHYAKVDPRGNRGNRIVYPKYLDEFNNDSVEK